MIGLRLDGEETFLGESIDTPAKNYLKKSEPNFFNIFNFIIKYNLKMSFHMDIHDKLNLIKRGTEEILTEGLFFKEYITLYNQVLSSLTNLEL